MFLMCSLIDLKLHYMHYTLGTYTMHCVRYCPVYTLKGNIVLDETLAVNTKQKNKLFLSR